MTDFTSPHFVGFAEGFGLDADHLERINEVLSNTPGILVSSIEAKLVDSGDVPGCGFTANLVDTKYLDIDSILNHLRNTNHFSCVSGFQINPQHVAFSGLRAESDQQFTLAA